MFLFYGGKDETAAIWQFHIEYSNFRSGTDSEFDYVLDRCVQENNTATVSYVPVPGTVYNG